MLKIRQLPLCCTVCLSQEDATHPPDGPVSHLPAQKIKILYQFVITRRQWPGQPNCAWADRSPLCPPLFFEVVAPYFYIGPMLRKKPTFYGFKTLKTSKVWLLAFWFIFIFCELCYNLKETIVTWRMVYGMFFLQGRNFVSILLSTLKTQNLKI